MKISRLATILAALALAGCVNAPPLKTAEPQKKGRDCKLFVLGDADERLLYLQTLGVDAGATRNGALRPSLAAISRKELS